jgi:hypothetical protein
MDAVQGAGEGIAPNEEIAKAKHLVSVILRSYKFAEGLKTV